MEMILNWSSSPTQIILVSSSLIQIPLPNGQSEATPEDVKWLSVVMSLNKKCLLINSSAYSWVIWFLWPGVKLWYFPLIPKFSKAWTILLSKLILSSLLIKGGKFHPLTFLATLALMETFSSFGSILVNTYSSTGMFQSCSYLVSPSILWYSLINGYK